MKKTPQNDIAIDNSATKDNYKYMALRGAEVFHGPLRMPGVKVPESTMVQQSAIDRSQDIPSALTSLGDPNTWVVESRDERDQREVEWGIARYIQEGGHLVSGDVHVKNGAFWQAINLAEGSGEILTPDEIHSYITKRSATEEGPLKSDRVIFEEVISEREASPPVFVLEPAA